MTPDQFIRRVIGAPWVKWASGFDGADCYGLVILWFREVRGIELGDVPHTDIAAGFAQASGWLECGPEPNATAWMAWRDGAPTHCGVLIEGGMVLHADGDDSRPGQVRVTRLTAMARLFPDMRFYRRAEQCL